MTICCINNTMTTISCPAASVKAAVSFAFTSAACFFSVLRFYFYYYFSRRNTSKSSSAF